MNANILEDIETSLLAALAMEIREEEVTQYRVVKHALQATMTEHVIDRVFIASLTCNTLLAKHVLPKLERPRKPKPVVTTPSTRAC